MANPGKPSGFPVIVVSVSFCFASKVATHSHIRQINHFNFYKELNKRLYPIFKRKSKQPKTRTVDKEDKNEVTQTERQTQSD